MGVNVFISHMFIIMISSPIGPTLICSLTRSASVLDLEVSHGQAPHPDSSASRPGCKTVPCRPCGR